MCSLVYIELKKALLDKGIKQRYIMEATQLSEGRISQLMHGRYKNEKFDAWILSNLNIDVPKLREQSKGESND